MSLPSSSTSCYESEIQFQTLTLGLIPGLPNDVGALILALIPYPHHSRLKSTCKSWKAFFSSKALIFCYRRWHLQISKLSHLLCIFPQDPSITSPYLFDPVNLAWCLLPPMPCNPHVYGLCNFTSISVGPHLYVLGGSLFDTRSFPLDRPSPSSSAFRFDFVTLSWERLSPMISPRGSFACVAIPNWEKILVAGGGSRHNMFGAAGSRMSSVEMYDIAEDKWVALDGLPRFRAGCVGVLVSNGEEREFWVMGGYGESRTVSGVFPVDEYYRDALVMELKNGGKWRELGDMWEVGERGRLGKIVALENEGYDVPCIFMLDKIDIFRYDMGQNRWLKETTLPRKACDESCVGFIALGEELYVMSLLNGIDATESQSQRARQHKRSLLMQIYNPRRKTWRYLITKPPFHNPLDFRTAVLCTIHL